MKEIVWVFGTSASGKNTFINEAVENEKLRTQLGWQNKLVIACNKSLESVYQNHGDAFANMRDEILDDVLNLIKSADVILIKWQQVDSKKSLIEKLQQLLPSAKHHIIFLQVPIEELMDRLGKRSWWNKHGEEKALFEKEFNDLKHWIQKRPELEITILDSSASGKYKKLN